MKGENNMSIKKLLSEKENTKRIKELAEKEDTVYVTYSYEIVFYPTDEDNESDEDRAIEILKEYGKLLDDIRNSISDFLKKNKDTVIMSEEGTIEPMNQRQLLKRAFEAVKEKLNKS